MEAENYGGASHELWKGVLAGLLGGLVASWTMNQVFTIWSKINENQHNRNSRRKKANKVTRRH